MQPKREVITVRDENGNPREIIRVTPYQRVQDLDGTSWTEGLASVFTADGTALNPLPDGGFQEVTAPHRRFWPI